jgi:hypothetical protein
MQRIPKTSCKDVMLLPVFCLVSFHCVCLPYVRSICIIKVYGLVYKFKEDVFVKRM